MKLDMVGIIVENMDRALAFYQQLGFELSGEATTDYLELKNEGVRISLNSKSMIEGIYGFIPASTGDKIELAFLCESPERLNETVTKMKIAGFEVFKEPWDAFWGQRYTIIKDPDNNLISLFSNL